MALNLNTLFGFESAIRALNPPKTTRPVGQVVKTAASHAVNIGSNPVRVTKDASHFCGNAFASLMDASSRGNQFPLDTSFAPMSPRGVRDGS